MAAIMDLPCTIAMNNALSDMGSYYFSYQVRYFAGFNYFTQKSEYTS